MTIIGFVSGHFVVGIFSIGTTLTVFLTIKNKEKYNIEGAQRIVFFAAYLCFFSTIASYLSVKSGEKHKLYSWILLFSGFFVYGATAYYANKLYDDLRKHLQKKKESQNR